MKQAQAGAERAQVRKTRFGERTGKRLVDRTPNTIRALSIIATLVVWELYGRSVNPIFLSYPTAIVAAFPSMISSGDLPQALVDSVKVMIIGWGIAIGAGVILGVLMGRYRLIDNLFEWPIAALYSTPDVALIPLLILWFGFGVTAKSVVVFYATFFPILINTRTGARDVSQDQVDIARVEGAREWGILRKIVLPSAAPLMLTGLKVSVGRAIVGMVVAEMLMVFSGLGGLVVAYGNQFATAKLLGVIMVLAVMGVGLTKAVEFLERLLLPWTISERMVRL